MPKDPRWLVKARSYLGQKEIKGRRHNPQILKWWTLIHAGFTDDETPWCAGFVGGVLESCGIKSSRSAAARSYLKWGKAISTPIAGCVTVFSRGAANGHVAFFLERTASGIKVLGGNQGDGVSIATYPASRLLGYRWPEGEPYTVDVPRPKPKPQPEPAVPPDVEPPVENEDDGDQTLSGRFKHWANVAGTAGATFLTALLSGDWRAVAAVCGVGFLIFCVIWFTHMRRQ
jgi:uncharacterized protein (TIGR02594 family)